MMSRHLAVPRDALPNNFASARLAAASPFAFVAVKLSKRRATSRIKIICLGSKVEAEWRRKAELSGPRQERGARQQWGPAARVKAEE
jgi:hypothetical protein